MNDGDSYKRRRKESFADEDSSCSNDYETTKEDFNDMNESSSIEENSDLDSTQKRKTRTMSEFHSEDRVKRHFTSVNITETQSPNSHENQSGSGRRLWWNECNRRDYPDDEFKKAFRLSKSTFELICFELNSVIAKEEDTVKQIVAVCIFWLASGEPLRLISKRFGLCISTCHKSFIEICSAIRSVLMPKYLKWPDVKSLRKIKEEFESISCIPNVVGSMYTMEFRV